MPSDEDLMSAIAEGDQNAFNTLVSRHLKMVYALAFQRLGHSADAEEVAQDVFTRLWQYAPRWEADAKITTWLYRVCVNRSIDILRRRKPTSGLEELPEIEDKSENAEQALAAKDTRALVRTALEELTPEQQDAIRLVYFADMKQQAAAEALGLSVAALESLLRRARKKLHAVLDGDYENLHR